MGGNSSRHVNMAKNQAPVYIQPRDLHQPIVPQPQQNVHKCNECGHKLPGEPWTIGIFDCADDREICLTGLFCPCVLFGRNFARIRDGETSWITPCICHAICVEGGIALGGITALCIDPSIYFLIYGLLTFIWGNCGIGSGQVRESIQDKYQLESSPCDPCIVHMSVHWCAICQEHRELEYRLSDNAVMPMTNAPPVQKMKADDDDDKSQDSGASSSANGIN